MRSWFRRTRPAPPADPERAFEAAVRDAAARLSAAVVGYDPAGQARLSGMHLSGVVDLRAVKQVCLTSPRESWLPIVSEHLAGVASALLGQRDWADFDRVQPLLRSRLYDEGALLLADVVGRRLAPGVVEALVVARAGTISTLPRAVLGSWGMAAAPLYPPARAAVRAEGRLPCRQVDLGGAVFTAVEAASFFTTTHLFWLDAYVEVPAAGAVVAMPNRHLLLAHPLRDAAAVDAVRAMAVNAANCYDQGPGGVSPHVYWWRGGTLSLLPALVTDDGVTLRPPVEFADLLRRLGG